MRCCVCNESQLHLTKYKSDLFCDQCLKNYMANKKKSECGPVDEGLKHKEEIQLTDSTSLEQSSCLHNKPAMEIKKETDSGDERIPLDSLVDHSEESANLGIEAEIEESTTEHNNQCGEDEEMSSLESNESAIDQLKETQIKDEITIEETRVDIVEEESHNDKDGNNDKIVKPHHFKCRFCDFRFKSFPKYSSHLIANHPEDKTAVCRICQSRFKGETAYRKHLQEKHDGFDKICKICLELFHGTGPRKDNQHRHQCLGRLLFNCKSCNKTFGKKEALWKHLDDHTIPEDGKLSSFTKKRVKEQFFSCVICEDDIAYQKSAYWKHITDAHQGHHIRCTYCPKTFKSSKDYSRHKMEQCKFNPEREFFFTLDVTCPECSKVFANQLTLKIHIQRIHRRKPQTCDICQLELSGTIALNRHKKIKHTKPKYHCPYCQKKFHILEKHKQHVASHLNERKFLCALCGFAFAHVESLRSHYRARHRPDANSGKKTKKESPSFECNECPRTFKSRFHYENHLNLHDPDKPKERPFICEECNMDFLTNQALLTHLNASIIHSKVKCEKCEVLFANAKKYDEHLRNETCEKANVKVEEQNEKSTERKVNKKKGQLNGRLTVTNASRTEDQEVERSSGQKRQRKSAN